MIRIEVDLTYPKFAVLSADAQRYVAVSIGPSHSDLPFISYQGYPVNLDNSGDTAMGPKSFFVSTRRPLLFSRQAFGIFGSVPHDTFMASRLASILSDLVLKGAVIVTDTDTSLPLTPDDILTFTP